MVLDVANVWTTISNFGRYGDPDANLPSAEWPGGSDNDYIWEGRFWVGALVQGKKRVSHADYGDYEFHAAEDDPFYLGSGKSILDSYVAFDDFVSSGTHEPLGIKIFQRCLSWSMPAYNDFFIIESEVINTGMVGNLSNFYVAWVFDNDVASADATAPHIDDNVDYDGWDGDDSNTDKVDIVDPLDLDNDGLDGYDEWGLPYGWTNLDNPNADVSLVEPDGVYDEYQIYLDDNGPVILGQAGQWAGQPLIDQATGLELHGWLISRNMSIIYDGDNNAVQGNDTGERGLPTPCDGWTGGRLIYTPHAPYYEAADDTLPRPFAHQWWNWNSDPGNDDEKYEYMSASHGAGMGFQFIPNPREIGAPTFDYRWLTSTGPFALPANQGLKFVYAHCLGQGLKGVRASGDQAMIAYYAGSQESSPANPSVFDADAHWVLPVPPPIPNLNYTGIGNGVRLTWDSHAEWYIDPLLGYSDFEGYKIYRAPYTPANWELIYACDNRENTLVYITNTEGDTLNPDNMVDLPDLTYQFEDTGGETVWGASYPAPINYVPYYYAVAAFDSYKEPTATTPEFMPQESARANYLKDPDSGAPMPVYPQNYADVVETPNEDLSNVKVVPNPYRGTNLFEAKYDETIRFINLPPVCKITVLTLAGDIVQELQHNDGTDSKAWDLLSKNTQAVVSGLYVYVVETDSDKKIGKFVIAR
ncbi:T9SS type A sorting domain-containing protein, partial [bacterium]|nr:T9SS type A sorting domain-containing protein [bacterium]